MTHTYWPRLSEQGRGRAKWAGGDSQWAECQGLLTCTAYRAHRYCGSNWITTSNCILPLCFPKYAFCVVWCEWPNLHKNLLQNSVINISFHIFVIRFCKLCLWRVGKEYRPLRRPVCWFTLSCEEIKYVIHFRFRDELSVTWSFVIINNYCFN